MSGDGIQRLVGVPATPAERATLAAREQATAQALASYGLTMELEAIRLAIIGSAAQLSPDSVALIAKSTAVADMAGQAAMQALKAAGVQVTVRPKEEPGQ